MPKENQTYSIYIDPKGAQIIASPDLRGKMNYDLIATLQNKYGKDIGVISIGPAGEAKMAASTIAITDQDGRPSRHAARGGLGAVMGSKGKLIYEVLAKLINARYGKNLKEEDVINIGINTIREELAFNRAAGWTDVQNRLPGFMETEKLPPNDVVFDVQQEEMDAMFKDLS